MVISADALTFSIHYLFDQSLDAVYINFPDPWPKHRHVKHRIIQSHFIQELRRTIKKEKKVIFVTDDLSYKEQMEDAMKDWLKVSITYENYGSSFFDRLWRSKGLDIQILCYANC